MSPTIDVPETYTERPKVAPYTRVHFPAVTVRSDRSTEGHRSMRLLNVAYDTLGEPDALRFFVQEDRVALLPAPEDHPHSYPLADRNVSVTWLKYELESGLPAEGRYELERDDSLWTVDFGAGPMDSGGEGA